MQRHDVVCLGDLRWCDADERARRVLARAACDRFVFYWERPTSGAGEPRLALEAADDGVMIARPQLPSGLPADLAVAAQRALIDDLLATQRIARPVLWYHTAAALGFTRHVRARAVVYDRLGRRRAVDDLIGGTQLEMSADVVLDEDPDAPLAWESIWSRVETACQSRGTGVHRTTGVTGVRPMTMAQPAYRRPRRWR